LDHRNQVTAFVGQNEVGKSNLFEALYCLNPIISSATYNPDEDWPVDQWRGKANAKGTQVCEAELALEPDEIADFYATAATQSTGEIGEEQENTSGSVTHNRVAPPTTITITACRSYGSETQFEVTGVGDGVLEKNRAAKWVAEMPKFVYIYEYEMSGEQVELDQLKQRWDNVGRANRHALSNEDQTVLIVLDLASPN
jgi:predicted ATP-dependent endonuclease of OLD family